MGAEMQSELDRMLTRHSKLTAVRDQLDTLLDEVARVGDDAARCAGVPLRTRDRAQGPASLHRAIGPDAPAQLARRRERSASRQGLQLPGLVAGKSQHRSLAGRAVHPLVGDLPRPARQMGLECLEGLEAAAGDGIALHVADATLVLSLGPRPIRRAGLDPEAPVPREGMQLRVQHHLAAGHVVAQDQRAGVIEQHLRRDAAEGCEGALHPREPMLLPLAGKRPHVDSPRVAERRHEERHQPQRAVDLDPPLTEIDLQLLARPGLEAHRRPRLGAQRLAQVNNRPLHRAQAHNDALLAGKLLAHHVGVATMTAEALIEPDFQPVQGLRARRRRRSAPFALPQPTPSRRPRAPELRRNPTCPQPSAFSFSMADTSSGSSISSLRRPPVRGSVVVVNMVIQTLLSAHRGGQILMSPEGQFVVSTDTVHSPVPWREARARLSRSASNAVLAATRNRNTHNAQLKLLIECRFLFFIRV